jgi:hypothetical protein
MKTTCPAATEYRIEEKFMSTPQTRKPAMSESDIDRVLSDSYPASDAPSWTLGVERPYPYATSQ